MNATSIVSNLVCIKDASDDALVAMINAGSRPAAAELYARHARSLRAIGVTRLGRRGGEDIANDVFMLVLEHARAGRFEPAPGKVGAWLRSVAIRMAMKRKTADIETELVDSDELISDAPVEGDADVAQARE
jgi:DNA-directed RNA polymerase specialized sigma24 family protein